MAIAVTGAGHAVASRAFKAFDAFAQTGLAVASTFSTAFRVRVSGIRGVGGVGETVWAYTLTAIVVHPVLEAGAFVVDTT